LEELDNWLLLSFEQLASIYKSTALALMVIDNKISYQEAFGLSRIEETY
jgi:chaperone required for assembly of F1-ATPase